MDSEILQSVAGKGAVKVADILFLGKVELSFLKKTIIPYTQAPAIKYSLDGLSNSV